MVIDKLYAVTKKSRKPFHGVLTSPREHAEEGTSNARLAGAEKSSMSTLKVPEILQINSVSEFFAKLEKEHSAAIKN